MNARAVAGRIGGAALGAWRARLVPLALAATLVLVVGGAFLYQATDQSARLMAAGFLERSRRSIPAGR